MLATMDCEDTALGCAADLYLAPAFKVSPETHAAVVRELEAVRAAIKCAVPGRPYVRRSDGLQGLGLAGLRERGCTVPLLVLALSVIARR